MSDCFDDNFEDLLMKPFNFPLQRSQPDEVDRSVARVQKAIVKLTQLMCQGDDYLFLKAATALGHMGIFAARPVASAINLAANPSHRRAMISLLRTLVSAEYMDVALVLAAIAANDPDERVRDTADELFHDMRNEAHQLGRREPPESQQGDDAPALVAVADSE
jgi:hypothetical protein